MEYREMTRLLKWLTFVALALAPTATPAQEAKKTDKTTEPAVVVQLKSFDGIFADVRYLAGLFDRKDDIDQIDALIKVATGDGGLPAIGLDGKRAVLAYAVAGSGPLDGPFAIMVP